MAKTFTLQDLVAEQQPEQSGAPKTFSLSDLRKELKVEDSAYEKGRKVSNPVERGINNALGGPTFGFWDEIAGAISAPVKSIKDGIPLAEAYRQGRDRVRGIQDQYKEDFPIGSVVTQSMASAPLSAIPANVPLLGAASTTNVIGPGRAIMGAMATGGTYGALSGAGESKADNLTDVLSDAAWGALKGAATSGATQGVMSLGGPLWRNFYSRRSPGAADDFARLKVAEALARDGRGSVFEEGLANPLDQAASRFRRLGPEARVVDAGGQNTKGLLDTLATLPGRTKNEVEQAIRVRQAGRADRIANAASSALQTGGRELMDQVDALAAQRARNAGPLYAAVRDVTVQIDDDVADLLSRTKSVHGEAEKLWKLQTGQTIDLSKVGKGDSVPFTMLDTLKQTLYDAASSAKRQGSNKMGLAFDDVRVNLTNKLDDLSPKTANGESFYRLARDAYAGPSQLIDAAELGSNAMTAKLPDLTRQLRDMTSSEREAFRIGAMQAIREKVGTQSGQTSLTKMWMEPATRDRLRLIFGDDYRQFAAAVAKESRLKGLESVGRGSQTASRLYGAGDMDVSPLLDASTAVTSAAAGNPMGVLSGVANMWNRVQTPEVVRNRMGNMLLQQGPEGLNTLRDLSPLVNQINRSRANQIGVSGYFGGQAGLLGQ